MVTGKSVLARATSIAPARPPNTVTESGNVSSLVIRDIAS